MDGWQTPLLFVAGADFGPFCIAEQREVDGTRPMSFFEFRWAAHIHQRTLPLPQLINREVLGISHA